MILASWTNINSDALNITIIFQIRHQRKQRSKKMRFGVVIHHITCDFPLGPQFLLWHWRRGICGSSKLVQKLRNWAWKGGEGECPKSQYIFLVRLTGCIPALAESIERGLIDKTGYGLKSALRTCLGNMNHKVLAEIGMDVNNPDDVALVRDALVFANMVAQYASLE